MATRIVRKLRVIPSTAPRRAAVLLLLLNGVPQCETMFDSYRPDWTSAGIYCVGTYFQSGKGVPILADALFGLNVQPYEVTFKERWWRVHIGYPVSPVTIDIEVRKKQIQGRVELSWLLLKLGATAVLWAAIETLLVWRRRATRPA